MPLINREVPKNISIQNQANTKRSTVKKQIKNTKINAADRKNIKVSPNTLNLIKTICTMKSLKNYEFVDEAIEFYIKNNMSDREQRILNNLNKN